MVASCPQDDLADVLSMSQQQDHSNQEVAALAEAVQATRTRRRSSRLANSSSGPQVLSITKAAPAPVSSKAAPAPEPSNSSRWSEAKEVKIVATACKCMWAVAVPVCGQLGRVAVGIWQSRFSPDLGGDQSISIVQFSLATMQVECCRAQSSGGLAVVPEQELQGDVFV
jgi:hypothetical protein